MGREQGQQQYRQDDGIGRQPRLDRQLMHGKARDQHDRDDGYDAEQQREQHGQASGLLTAHGDGLRRRRLRGRIYRGRRDAGWHGHRTAADIKGELGRADAQPARRIDRSCFNRVAPACRYCFNCVVVAEGRLSRAALRDAAGPRIAERGERATRHNRYPRSMPVAVRIATSRPNTGTAPGRLAFRRDRG